MSGHRRQSDAPQAKNLEHFAIKLDHLNAKCDKPERRLSHEKTEFFRRHANLERFKRSAKCSNGIGDPARAAFEPLKKRRFFTPTSLETIAYERERL